MRQIFTMRLLYDLYAHVWSGAVPWGVPWPVGVCKLTLLKILSNEALALLEPFGGAFGVLLRVVGVFILVFMSSSSNIETSCCLSLILITSSGVSWTVSLTCWDSSTWLATLPGCFQLSSIIPSYICTENIAVGQEHKRLNISMIRYNIMMLFRYTLILVQITFIFLTDSGMGISNEQWNINLAIYLCLRAIHYLELRPLWKQQANHNNEQGSQRSMWMMRTQKNASHIATFKYDKLNTNNSEYSLFHMFAYHGIHMIFNHNFAFYSGSFIPLFVPL